MLASNVLNICIHAMINKVGSIYIVRLHKYVYVFITDHACTFICTHAIVKSIMII